MTKTEKYPLNIAPHLLVPINHKNKYAIHTTYTIDVLVPKPVQDMLEKMKKILGTELDIFYMRDIIAKQIQTKVRKEYPKAAFANIVHAHKTFGGSKYDVSVDVDVLQ